MTTLLRILLLIPLGEELVVGGWNQFAPASFYDDFPTVDLNPPFSDHFAHDFGGATLGIALLLAIAFVKPRTHFVVPAALAYSMFAVPHFFYHLLNTEVASPGQQALLTIANAVVALLGLAPIPVALLRDRRTA
ncbi:hypothetical protein [Kutzneria chonburiensis]|uniref:Uncharacterized protein n=1 Tax=Kutzneria chonburiensis TaxID=1483604 RepID=A0ABV6MKB1_9PSEU|nr:hypothetical protein [Kutzneria chonburiensis]